ncbi:RNA-binding domain-containing protein [Methanothermococcus sp.]|uniref:RNA-binding domain-containing protein n=1 Tax=Methanothermococcus sp. TaxID=2614238 RepID=UPI0025EB3906|nr:RNA-binding domain-containing protein [Methanothermococcus sp.]
MKNIEINSVSISSISHATEDEDKVLEAIAYFLPENIDEENLEVETINSEGCFGNPIFIHKITIDKSKMAKKVFNHIMQLMKSNGKNITKLKKDIDLRIEKSKIYLRFDKQRAYLKECKLVDGDDIIRIIINFKIYVPKNKEQKVKELMLKELEK